jgi:hypothetical protein
MYMQNFILLTLCMYVCMYVSVVQERCFISSRISPWTGYYLDSETVPWGEERSSKVAMGARFAC